MTGESHSHAYLLVLWKLQGPAKGTFGHDNRLDPFACAPLALLAGVGPSGLVAPSSATFEPFDQPIELHSAGEEVEEYISSGAGVLGGTEPRSLPVTFVSPKCLFEFFKKSCTYLVTSHNLMSGKKLICLL